MASGLGSCDHKQSIGCILGTIPTCCACADRRPLASAYATYVDGSGMKLVGSRWQKYCWKCRDYWGFRQTEEETTRPRPPQEDQSWSFSSHPLPQTLNPFTDMPRRNGQPDHHQQQPPFRLSSANNSREIEDSVEVDQITNVSSLLRPGPPRDPAVDLSDQSDPSGSASSTQASSRRQRRAANPFGTREEWESPDYQSPLAGMFTRAWTRYREAEDNRRQAGTELPRQMQGVSFNDHEESLQSTQYPASSAPHAYSRHYERSRHNNSFSLVDDLAWNTPNALPEEVRRVHTMASNLVDSAAAEMNTHGHPHAAPPGHANPFTSSLFSIHDAYNRANVENPFTRNYGFMNMARPPSPPRENPIDVQTARPPPLTTEDMTVSIACRICTEQKVDTLLMPCSHVAMCGWCVQLMREESGRKRERNGLAGQNVRIRGEGWKCPICRRGVEGTRKVYLG
ncbi:uncharacterized protein HMPREF1541_05214 [Cyphellophora europaea CBS 101466]|uniref:RING-type domain-containing protein n=1 Tax=Cyphellophora europaea (strain CBS 101466) TaxID=1220924 RepID=W2RZ42_CYPE1|nr:uncharacterized protein HMPREF1541_05214 [Cyphellophora europaea CBS 101466]ETN40934.1 hypothetical protein HMPREF1541_05214 [Cyphellophora europaea CBS 101466]